MDKAQEKLLQAHFLRARQCALRGKCDAGIVEAVAGGMLARELGDADRVQNAGSLLEKLGAYRQSWAFLSDAGRMKRPGALPEWDGSMQSGKTLLVTQRIRDLGAPIRLGRLIAHAAKCVGRCIVLAEPRLVPLFRRSFPDADIRSETAADAAEAGREAQIGASYETLGLHLAPDADDILRSFVPLKADRGRTSAFRARYARAPRVGISWASLNTKKELPGLDAWIGLLKSFDANYVSLQYGDTASDLAALRTGSGRDIIEDAGVDQLRDMDGFAAQLAALDAVLTISNTAAHTAGALGVPAFVVLGDKLTSMWPVVGSSSPWYPHTTLVQKQRRGWDEAFSQLKSQLAAAVAQAAKTGP